MPLPNMIINFAKQAETSFRRSGRKIVAVIVKDSGVTAGLYHLGNASTIPAGLSAGNKEYVKSAFIGNINRPAKVILCVIGADAENYTDAFAALATQQWDYLACPPDCDVSSATATAAWIKGQRTNNNAKYKAVLPNMAADDPAIINFVADGIAVGETEYDAGEYCARIAGLLAGTPISQSATYAVMPEVSDIDRMTKTDMDTAIDAGKLILIHDGIKVKVARGVTSLTTVSTTNPVDLKKIKIVEAIDMINTDLRTLCEDYYIGKYANSYDNKCVLLTAIREYLVGLEADGVLEPGKTTVEIDINAQRDWLEAQDISTADMDDDEVKHANTGSFVFIAAKIQILDAIEDITININF